MYFYDQAKRAIIEKEDDVIVLVAFLSRLTVEQVKTYHPRIKELDDVARIIEPATSEVPEITEVLEKTITNLIEMWRHSSRKKILLQAFSKAGTAWKCECTACNKKTPVYDEE